MTLLDVVLGIAVLALSAAFVVSAFARGRLRARSGVALVGRFADVVVFLLLARLLQSWSVLTPWAWLVPVGLVAAGVAGAILRWPELSIWRPDRPRWRAIVALVLRAAIVVLVTVLVFWP